MIHKHNKDDFNHRSIDEVLTHLILFAEPRTVVQYIRWQSTPNCLNIRFKSKQATQNRRVHSDLQREGHRNFQIRSNDRNCSISENLEYAVINKRRALRCILLQSPFDNT
jgi:hypothetical protein